MPPVEHVQQIAPSETAAREHLELQTELYRRNEGTIFCFRIHFWKRNFVRAYLRSPNNRVIFAETASKARRLGFNSDAHALVWGQRATGDILELTQHHNVPLWRMEDGFLRSVGLGSNLAAPASLVIDRLGIYYDPTAPSELESILEDGETTVAELDRARRLRESIVSFGISKYNLGNESKLVVPDDRPVVLVPGQVADDASVTLGCRDIKTNLGLLEQARRANPDAYIIYKPHPDVVSGNREGGGLARAREFCDHIEPQASLAQCLSVVSEVHTMTSLVGFESLLRGLRVVVYGQPFYSGWGLTVDRHPVQRRTRKLNIDELVLGVLIRYPRYVVDGRFASPEAVVEKLRRDRASQSASRQIKLSWPRRQLRKLKNIYRALTYTNGA